MGIWLIGLVQEPEMAMVDGDRQMGKTWSGILSYVKFCAEFDSAIAFNQRRVGDGVVAVMGVFLSVFVCKSCLLLD